jgi:LacI family transcriptional regulator
MKIEEIAKMAQVSKAAVSLALNGKAGVSSETREKILKIVKETGYAHRSLIHTNPAASNQRIIRFIAFTNSGILTNEYEKQTFFSELLHYVEDQCRNSGYSLLFTSVNMENFFQEVEKLEKDQESSGLILLGTNLTQQQIHFIAEQQPNFVVLDTCFENLSIDFVAINNVLGAYQAGEYLLQLGHRNIGYAQSVSRMYNFDMRQKGFTTALQEQEVQIAENHIFNFPPANVSSLEEFKQHITKLKNNLPTAIFCECDYIAISVIKSLTELGIRVPHDISVIGFDNISEARIITPELTTIHVEKDQLASIAVKKLIQLIEDPSVIRTKTFLDTKLVERQSCRAIELQ